MNKSDTERMLGMLSNLGYDATDDEKKADVLIINTCNIRQLSADKAYSQLGFWGKLKKNKPSLKIGMCGCVAQQDKELVRRRAPYVDFVFGTLNIPALPDIIKKVENDEKVIAIEKNPILRDAEDGRIIRGKSLNAWIPIIDGCDYFCTYCVVPYVRGRQRSRNWDSIIKEATLLINKSNVSPFGGVYSKSNLPLEPKASGYSVLTRSFEQPAQSPKLRSIKRSSTLN